MSIEALLERARRSVPSGMWSEAVELARAGAVQGVSESEDEIHLKVKVRGKALPLDVWVWPAEGDFECDVAARTPDGWSVPVVASLIALRRAVADGGATLPEPKAQFKVKLRYALRSEGSDLWLDRQVVWPDGRVQLLRGTLADNDLVVGRGDAQAETLLAMHPGGPLPGEMIRRLLRFLEGRADATLDGAPVELSPEDLPFEIRVLDDGDGFKLGLFRPSAIDKLFRGAALVGATLHPTSHGDLSPKQRKELTRGVHYTADQMHLLVNETLPRLRLQIPVIIQSSRLPAGDQLEPRVVVQLQEVPLGLRVLAVLEYGDPPVARVEEGILKTLGDVVPARDMGRERMVMRQFSAKMGVPVGVPVVLPPERAAAFLEDKLPHHDGSVRGRISRDRYAVLDAPVAARFEVVRHDDAGGRPSWQLDIAFEGDRGAADPWAVLEAWRAGRSLVPLFEGGFAPLPRDLLDEHGAILRELLEARDASGRVDRNATAALVELLEGNEHDVPPDLSRLRDFVAGGEDLPPVPIPRRFKGELRPYQLAGHRWLAFLRHMDIHGILADDMGLGKTIQALTAIASAGGQTLVVAPTSVLRNWEREAERFLPGASVNLYHGPDRKLDKSTITLTSYAILRLDLDLLRERVWTYAILDEAQSIKNHTSQTARSAYQLRAEHRLCLTGTPIENRLEELWSLFRFLMPGLLGSVESFRERFVRPIEAGSQRAREDLNRRVRPYVLRRLKQQVAPELPTLTEMVVRCEMGPDQRRIYEAVRLAARNDVQRVIAERGMGRATFQVLEALLRMRQACCDPSLLPGEIGLDAGSCKLDRLEELLVEIIVEDHKALIFSQWTSLLDRVERRLERLGIAWVRLDGSTRNRQDVIDAFQDPSGPPVFLLSLKAGGTGLNLTAADYVVHLDPWWNPAVEQQATDRAHRIGQDKPVVSCRLIAEGTVEERILDLQDAKRDLADAALGTDGGFVQSLSTDELRSLFEDAI
jgi:superfamily II DNA or RNA helicase